MSIIQPVSRERRITGFLQLRLVLASAALCLIVVAPPVSASDDPFLIDYLSIKSPEDNAALRRTLTGTVATHDAAVILGIASPGPLGTPAELTAIGTDLALKHTAAVFSLDTNPPIGAEVYPDSPATNGNGTPNCVYKLGNSNRPVLDDGNSRGISEGYASIFGIRYDPLDNVWSELGAPYVWHPHAEIEVSVNNKFLSAAGYPGQDSETLRNLQRNPELPEGEHRFSWSASTGYNQLLDVYLPIALMGLSAAAENMAVKKLMARGHPEVAAKQIAKNAFRLFNLGVELELTAAEVANVDDMIQWLDDNTTVGAINRTTQTVKVWDIHTPYILDASHFPASHHSRSSAIDSQDLTFEATDFGGVKFSRVAEVLRESFDPFDDCGDSFFVSTDATASTLLTIGDEPNLVTWYADETDGGPYPAETQLADNQQWIDGKIRTSLVQRIHIVDTQSPLLLPPAGFARYDEDGIDLAAEGFPIGRPRVVDLADPSPKVFNDAPDFLAGPPEGEDGVRYTINWGAYDASGNTTAASPLYSQKITLKRPGTNTTPEALDASANAITAKAIDIELRGIDTDLIDGTVDPLEFRIDTLPDNGTFEAPLFPYFIEDFRLTPVGEREEGDELTRTSPLLHLADRFRLALNKPTFPADGSEIRGTVLNQEICVNPSAESQAAFNGVIPVDFVYQPKYVYVDDRGDYYILDHFFRCGVAESTISWYYGSGELSAIPRISKWSPDGELVDMMTLVPGLTPDLPSADCIDRSYNPPHYFGYPNGEMYTDSTGRFWLTFRTNNVTIPGDQIYTHCSVPPTLDAFTFHGTSAVGGIENPGTIQTVGIAQDSKAGVLYHATDRNGILVHRTDQPVSLGGNPGPGTIGKLDKTAINDSTLRRVRVDSQGNVYFLGVNKIHKYLPTRRTGPDSWELGAYVGWLGACTGNQLIPGTSTPYNRCDIESGTSRGYSCTDLSCTGGSTSGDKPGQFFGPSSIEIDPKDVVYVADAGNSRVQRFSPEGAFGGEAKSTGTGINQGDSPGFIIGNMGVPQRIAVNSSALFVMEPNAADGDEFVHVFKTLPFRDVTESTATVRYVSNFNYQGSDSFSYVVDDGIDVSAPANVSISIERAYRRPENLRASCFHPGEPDTAVDCSVHEDASIHIRLDSDDPDGFVSDTPFGLDQHTFAVAEAPQNGAATVDASGATDSSALYLYTPDPDFNGDDSITFSVFDGVDYADENVTVDIAVGALPDPAVITPDGPFVAARGFPRAVNAAYSDVDNDPEREPQALYIDWGDDTVARRIGKDWVNTGNTDPHGEVVSPQFEFGANRGMLLASHRYDAVGSYTVAFAMQNPAPFTTLPDTIATASIEVIDATAVAMRLQSPASPVMPDETFPLLLEIRNFAPDGWAGLDASNVSASIDVPEGLNITAVDPRCTSAQPMVCDLGTLAPDQSALLAFAASVALDEAREQAEYLLQVEMTDDGPTISDRNIAVASISIADRDADGVIDADDAFPDDPTYSVDSDGDGLADEWEVEYGFDPLVADDTSSDTDGDGYTLLEEFLLGGFAHLAQFEQFDSGTRLESPNNNVEDRIGLAMASADLNLDGYSDLVIGASTYKTNGGVFISYGSESGASSDLQTLRPAGGQQAMGRALATGDWDDNGYPDIAIAVNNFVLIYYNFGEIIAAPDRVLSAGNGNGAYGIDLISVDIDGDSIDDLIVNRHNSPATTSIEIYASVAGGIDAAPAVFAINDGYFSGQAIGDVDGDGKPDLVLGALASQTVRGYLASDNSWQPGSGLTASFELAAVPGQSQFGHELASGEDVTGDGIDDLVVGSYAGSGFINLFASESLYWTDNGAAPLQTLSGQGTGPGDTHPDQFGVSIAMAHLDSDEYADIIAGANRAGTNDQGQVRILHGSPAGFLANEQQFDGTTTYDLLGHNVAIAGDMNGDGFIDIAGGASNVSTAQHTSPDGGYVQVYYHTFAAVDPSEDTDNDGVRAAIDNCTAVANSNQADFDGDGIGDACDPDIDNDGTSNEFDTCPYLATADQTDSDGDGNGDACDADDDNDGVPDEDDAFPLNPDYSADSDGDGMPDAYESAHGLDNGDASDAAGDLDGDGRSNLEEFEQGTDINADDVAPQLSVPADIVVGSIGPRTVVALGAATAVDFKDGARTATPDTAGPFKPGRHAVTWSALDEAGNEATLVQQVDVLPQAGFVGDTLHASENMQTTLLVALNGDAVSYPVTIPYTVSGTASPGADYTLSAGNIVIDNSNVATIALQTISDGELEGEESIVITLGSPVNAIAGPANTFTVVIAENNLPPLPELAIEQAERLVTTVTQDGGPVTVFASPADPDSADSHSFQWSASDNALVPQQGYAQPTFTFDPFAVAEGVYRLGVEILDNGTPGLSATQYRYVRVIATSPELIAGDDRDQDGLPDVDEELRDSNANGTSDYLDPSSVRHLVVARTGSDALLQTSDGYSLSLGRTALATGDDATVSMMDLVDIGSDGAPAPAGRDERFSYPAGMIDVEVRGLPKAGHSVYLVAPLASPVPADAKYRLLLDGLEWSSFESDSGNAIFSAPGDPGVCPAAGSALYRPGLNAGDHCVQLRIEDGGPNDSDGVTNGIVRSSGGLAVSAKLASVSAVSHFVPDKNVDAGSRDVVMLRFSLDSNTSDVVLNDLTLRASGSGNDGTEVRAVKVRVDLDGNGAIDPGDPLIGTGNYGADDGELRLQMTTPYRVDAGITEFIISYDF